MHYTEEQLKLIEQINAIIQRINIEHYLKLTFKNNGIVHVVSEEDAPIIVDSLETIKTYLHGMEYGLIKNKRS